MALTTDWDGLLLDGIVILTCLFISFLFYIRTPRISFENSEERSFENSEESSFEHSEERSFPDPGIVLGKSLEEQIPPSIFDGKAPSYFLKELYERAKDEPYISFYISDKPFLLLCDRKLIERVLITDCPSYFCNRYSSANPNDRIGYTNLFFIKDSDCPSWETLKNNVFPFIFTGSLEKMFGLMLECGKHLDKYLESLKFNGNEQIIDVMDVSFKFTMDVISRTAFGLDMNTFEDEEFRRLDKILKENRDRRWEMLAMFFLPDVTRKNELKVFDEEIVTFLREILQKTMTERKNPDKIRWNRFDLIDVLIEIEKSKDNVQIEHLEKLLATHENLDEDALREQASTLKDFSDDDLLAQAASFFLLGFETTSTTTAFALYNLAVHPKIQNTLRKELLEALKKCNGKVTDVITWSLPYLDMVVSETLRMYPPLGFLNRMAMQDYKVPEYNLVIEKGTPVYISMLGLHYDPKYFPDPNEFNPERFNEENKLNRPACVYFPFGEGPRACFGQRFALLQTKLTLLKILSKYEVTLCEKTSVPVEIDPKKVMTMPLNGVLYLNFRKINTNAI